MKLRKLARQLAAAAVAGCMALSLCMPALAETWDLANKTQYPYGESAWIEVRRYPAEQKLTFLRAADETLYEYDEEPVFKGSFWTLDLQGRYGTAATVTLQGANIEYPANSHAAMCTMGDVDLTLSGSNAVTHTNAKPAIDIDYSDYPNDSPGKLTITGSGSLTVTGPSTGVLIEGGSTLDVAGGTVSVTAAG